MRRLLLAFACLPLLPGCAEMRAPAAMQRVPPVLAAGSADPVVDAVGQAALAFADAGRSLAGNPAATARATAQVEVLAVEFARDPRWAPLPSSVGFAMAGARTELRAALGTRANADPDAVARALAAAHAALLRGDNAAAAAALPATLFEPGGNVVVARLAQPGPLSQTQIATARARDAVEGLVRAQRGGIAAALDPSGGWGNPIPGALSQR
jgi:hypothetical protein